jgi:glyoxalase family protein
VGSGVEAGYIEVQGRPGQPRGHIAAGSVHHVAFRVADDAQQAAWSAQLHAQGVSVTDVRDRQYFRSIYFHEPAGIVFEIATDAPGFAIDEPLDQLGQKLMLPPWLEAKRTDIEWALPQLIADSR